MSKIDEIGIKLSLSLELIEKLISIGKVITVNKQEKLIEIGQKSNIIYLIVRGGFVCQCIDEQTAEERTVNFYLENYQPLMTVVDSFF